MTNIHQFEPLWGVWKIEEELGEGSYGKVYKAVRNEFGATYYAAIKHISIPINQTEIRNLYEEGLAADEGSARRYYERMLANLLQEIRLMSALKGHTNIVAYEDHMTIEKRDMPGYDVFIRMELLKGLYEHARSTKFTVLDVCNLGIDICTALEILQKKNIVHRDIKPANILYSDDGNYKLSDFGVARTLEHNATVMSKKGTYAYMAPEVYGGQPASFNSDVYSLGLVMHRLLNNNRAPFLPTDGSTVTYEQNEEALMRRMGGEAIPYPVNADQSMATLLAIACDFKPEYRFQDAGQFKEALLSYRQDIAPNQYAVIREGEGVPSERSASNKANMTAKELRQKKAEIERQKKELERQERELAEAAEVERREAEEAAKEQERVRKAEEKQRRKTEEKRKAGEKEPKKSKAAAIIAVAAAAIIIACVLALSLGKDKPNDNMEASVLTTTPVIVTAGEPAIEPRPLNAESIKASNHHTVGLRSDGTVVAAGSNSYGQCNVDEWSNIARIAAGAHHTVGLKKNGTVVAAGSNSYGQCNVNGWNNIAEIATGAYHTVGLKKDGTAVATGWNGYGQCNVNGWNNIARIAVSRYHTVGLRADGTVVAAGSNSYGQCNVNGWNNIAEIATGTYHTVGLRADGTVVATGSNDRYGECEVNGWNNIAEIATGEHHTVGLRADGTVVATGSNSYGQCNVNGWNNIAEIAAGEHHTVGLRADGTVVATGSNNDGECNISEWTDIVAIAAGPRFALGLKSDGTVVAAGNNEYGQCNVESWNIKADSDASTVQNTEVRLSVDNSIKRSDTASTMTVNGTMETGASISVSGVELEGAVTQDSNAGTFSFTVKTANVGVYEAVITATKGDAVRTSTVYLEHQPDRDSYMKGVYKMNYNNIKQYPTHKQGYKIVGKVTEVIQSTPYVKARIQTSDGDMIFCYYSGVAAIEARDGKTYELYGDPYGTDDASGLPQLHAWFILKRSGEPN